MSNNNESNFVDKKNYSVDIPGSGEISLNGLFNVISDAKRGRYDHWLILSKFLGAKQLDMVRISKSFSNYRAIPAIKAFDDYLKTCDKYTALVGDGFDVYPTKLSIKEDIKGWPIELIGQGLYLVENYGEKFCVWLEEATEDDVEIQIVSTNEKTVYRVLDEISRIINETSLYRGQIVGPDGGIVELDREYNWDDIILGEEVVKQIERNVTKFFEKSELYSKFGVPTKRGVVLHGPPGTGKTLCVKILVSKLSKEGKTCIVVNPGDVLGVFKEKGIKEVYRLASDYSPSLVVLEDFDFYAVDREDGAGKKTSLLGEILEAIDGVETRPDIVTVVTTNRLKSIDDALKNRPGRFDKKIEFPAPSTDLVKRFFEKYGEHISMGEVGKVVDNVPIHFTGAHIRELINYATILAIEESDESVSINSEHLMKSIEAIKSEASFSTGSKVGFRGL